MRITAEIDESLLEKAIEAAAIAGIAGEKILEEALKTFVLAVKMDAERHMA